ncbi:unnamed protein product [Schistosoma mattheei]|uniref:Uncharacterized protein n=1 Tax=Schistosoma mattheei TaxID=31246 RepID=A0A183PED8_9TREM|nr:unnamed protein product [Schistosoma mattheei]
MKSAKSLGLTSTKTLAGRAVELGCVFRHVYWPLSLAWNF